MLVRQHILLLKEIIRMFLYEKNNLLNFVDGRLPEDIPALSVGFVDGEAVILYGGVAVQLSGNGGTVAMSETIPFNGAEMTVSNPDLTAKIVDGNYYIGGTMAPVDPAVKAAWGYGDDVKNVFVVKVTFEGDIDPETFSGTCVGTESKPISYDKFDGPNYIYYIFNGNVKEFTITYKANADAEEKTIKIYNEATLA